MIRRLIVSRDAEVDLTLIWVYYAEKSERAAKRIRQEISSKYSILLQFPQAGRTRDEIQKGLRSFPVGNYVIFYREIEDGIEIVRVLHSAQDTQGFFLSDEEIEPPSE